MSISNVLAPLLEVGSPTEFVALLEQCHLPQTAPDEVLAGWHADRHLIDDTWSEFISLTRGRRPIMDPFRAALRLDHSVRATSAREYD